MDHNIINDLNTRALEPRIDFPSVEDITDGVKNVFNSGLGEVKDGFNSGFDGVKDIFHSAIGEVKENVDKVKGTLDSIQDKITDAAKEQLTGLLGKIFGIMLLAQLLVVLTILILYLIWKYGGPRIMACFGGRRQATRGRKMEENWQMGERPRMRSQQPLDTHSHDGNPAQPPTSRFSP